MGYKVNKDMIDLTPDQAKEKIRNGELQVPEAGSADRAEFYQFLNAEPGSEERKKFLDEGDPDSGDTHPPKKDESGDTPPPDDNKEDKASPPEPPREPDEPPTPPAEDNSEDEWAGYESKDEMVKAHRSLLDAIEKKQREVNNLRSSGGKQGRKIKDLQAQIAKQTEEMERLRKTETGHSPADRSGDIQKPDKPKKPNPSDFEDGEVDSAYEEAVAKWEKEVEGYPEKYDQYIESLQEKNKQHADPKESGDPRVEEVYEHYKTEKEQKEEAKQQQAWNNMWSETSTYQKSLGCETKTPLSQINEQQLILLDNTADKEAKDAAKAFLEALPKSDLDNYKRMIPIINGMYFQGDANVPKKAYSNLQAALWDLTDNTGKPLADRFKNAHEPTKNMSQEQAEKVEQNRKHKKESVAAPSADGQSSGDDRLDQPQTTAEKKTRLSELLAMRRKNVKSFDNDDKLSKEFSTLVKDLGFMRGGGR